MAAHALAQLLERGGQRRQLGQGGGHAPMMTDRRGRCEATAAGRPRLAARRRRTIPSLSPGPEGAGAPSTIECPCPSTASTCVVCPPTGWPSVLPRPPAEETFPSDAVRAILDEVRAGGDEAVRALTRRFDGVDVDALRVPRRGPRRRPGRARPRPAGRARGGLRPDPRLPPPRAGAGRRLRERRGRGPTPAPARGAGRAVRPGGTGALSLDRAHVRRPGPGGRRGRARAVRAARARRRHRGRDPGGRGHRRHRRGLPRGRGPGRRGHGLRHRVDPAASTSSSAPATATWPRPSARCRGWWASPRPSPGPPRWWWSPTTTPRWRGPPSTSWSRPSTAPTAWPGW